MSKYSIEGTQENEKYFSLVFNTKGECLRFIRNNGLKNARPYEIIERKAPTGHWYDKDELMDSLEEFKNDTLKELLEDKDYDELDNVIDCFEYDLEDDHAYICGLEDVGLWVDELDCKENEFCVNETKAREIIYAYWEKNLYPLIPTERTYTYNVRIFQDIEVEARDEEEAEKLAKAEFKKQKGYKYWDCYVEEVDE